MKSVREAWQRYYSIMESHHPKTYLDGIRLTYSQFARFAGEDMPLETVTLDVIRDWLATRKVAAGTKALQVRHLGCWLTFCVEEEFIERNPLEEKARLRLPRANPQPTPLPADDDIRKLVTAAAVGRNRVRNTALVLLMIASGGRVAEIARAGWVDLNLDAGINENPPFGLVKLLGKGNKPRLVPIEADCVAAVNAWARHPKRPPHSIFGMSSGAIREQLYSLAIGAGIPKIAPHMLRVAYANAIDRENPNDTALDYLQKTMGHATKDQTRGYLRPIRVQRLIPGTTPLHHYGIQALG